MYFYIVVQVVGVFYYYLFVGFQVVFYYYLFVFVGVDGDVVLVDFVVGVDYVYIDIVGVVLYGVGWNGQYVFEGLCQQVYVDELVGEQFVVGVFEVCFEFDCVGGGVDLVVQGGQGVFGENFVLVVVQCGDCQFVGVVYLFDDGVDLLLWQVEYY